MTAILSPFLQRSCLRSPGRDFPDNSPAIYGWGYDADKRGSPVGTIESEAHSSFSRPYGTQGLFPCYSPAINCWAIVNSPCETKKSLHLFKQLLSPVF
jgi:hypothetical protein